MSTSIVVFGVALFIGALIGISQIQINKDNKDASV